MIKKLILQNYKGFQTKTEIEFSLPNGKYGSGLNVIIGANNSGKSAIFDALDKFGGNNPVINDEEVQKASRNNFMLELITDDNSTHLLKTIGSGGTIDNQNSTWLFNSKVYKIGTNKQWLDTGPIGQLSNVDYVIAKYNADPNFIQVLQSIEGKPKKVELINLIKKVVPNFTNYSVNYSNNQAYIEYTTGNNIDHKAGNLGEGVTGIFKLLVPLISINENDRILIIDEPELSLHPQAQKELIKIYSEYASKIQIIIATHSPIFIDWKSIHNDGQIIRISKPGDKNCKVNWLSKPSKIELAKIADNKNRPFVLDSTGKELFFTDNIVLCEGQTDPVRYRDFVNSNYEKTNYEFFGYGCGSDAQIIKFIPIFKELDLKVCCIFDKPIKKDGNLNPEVQANIDKAKNILPGGVFVSPTNEVQYLFTENDNGVKNEFQNELKSIFDELESYFE
jgi:AAA15 family ATPase/GTPase